MSRAKEYTPILLKEAIKNTGGIISAIANKLQCSWQTAFNYINKWPETKEAYNDELETILDLAESTIYTSIKENNDVQSAKWLLSTKGKKRGFTEKFELMHSGEIEYKIKPPPKYEDQEKEQDEDII